MHVDGDDENIARSKLKKGVLTLSGLMNPSTSRRFLQQDCWATAMVTVVVVALLGELGAGFVSCERVRMREGRKKCSDVVWN